MRNAILLISSPDQQGITAAIASFVAEHNGNIEHAEQHIDNQTNTFFIRIEWSLENFSIKRDQLAQQFEPLARKFKMNWKLYFTDEIPKLALFVSKPTHCLYDLLLRQKSGHIKGETKLIVSNHKDAEEIAQSFKIPFHFLEITKDNKRKQEQKQRELLKKENIDLIILARYHQLLSPEFVKEYPGAIINIHHSFLPAFAGKNPYAQAYEKGVKIIGATSHFVTDELDQGPIIEQDIARISHRDTLNDLISKGEDLEKLVLSRAVKWYLERKVLAYGNKTVIFD